MTEYYGGISWQLLWQDIRATHRHFECIDSTNTALIADVANGKLVSDVMHLYTADTQSAGRGQHGRSWVSTPGNVFLSLYIPMMNAPLVQAATDTDTAKTAVKSSPVKLSRLSGLISLIVGLKLSQMSVVKDLNAALASLNKPVIGVKWANDLGYYADDHDSADQRTLFQKLVGILIEPVYAKVNDKPVCTGIVVGVGLNVTHGPAIKDGLYHAASLHELWASAGQACVLTAHDLYAPMCQAICAAIDTHNTITDGGAIAFGTVDADTARGLFIDEFSAAHVLQDKPVNIYTRDEMDVVDKAGVVTGIGADGALLLRTDSGPIAVYAGMVQSA